MNIQELHSRQDLSLNTKVFLAGILQRSGKTEFCDNCRKLIDFIGEIMENQTELNQVISEIQSNLHNHHPTYNDTRSMIEESIQKKDHTLQTLLQQISKLEKVLTTLIDYIDEPKILNIREPREKKGKIIAFNLRKELDSIKKLVKNESTTE